MVRIAACFAVSLLVFAAACGGDSDSSADAAPDADLTDAPPPDASIPDGPPPADLSCLGAPPPNTANDPLTLMGATFSIGLGGADPVPNAVIDVLLESDPDGIAVATGTTDMNGAATLSVPTGGVPVEIFTRATPADTFLTTETFFPNVVSADTPAPSPMFEAGTINLLGSASGQNQDLVNNGFGIVLLIDCVNNPIRDATIIPPSGAVVYLGENGIPDTNLTSTSGAGAGVVFNVTPGEDLTFDAEVEGQSLRDNVARAVAGQIVSIGISP